MVSQKTTRARDLRNNPTEAKQALWRALKERTLGFEFRRQYPVGPYFADIVCKNLKIIIEIDGGQHDASSSAERQRTAHLESKGYRVLRFWNNDVLGNIEGVMTEILKALNTPPHPPRSRGGVDEASQP